MTNKKISALTAATTPLAGTETLPIVQGGATKKVSVADLTAGRAVEVGQLYSGIAYNSGRRINTQASAGETAAYIGGVNGYILVDNVDSGNSYASQSVAFTIQDMAGNPIAIFNSSSKNVSFYGNLTQLVAAKGINFTANTPASGMTSQLLNWYEEGTWTPAPNSGTFSSAVGRYTRIGRQVTLTFDITVGTGGGTTMTAPINSAITTANGIYTSGQDFAAGTTAPVVVIGGSGNTIYFRSVGDNVAFSSMSLTANASVSGSLTYFV